VEGSVVRQQLSLRHILALLQAENAGVAEDLASLAISLLVYDTAIRQGLLTGKDTERSVPRALCLVRRFGWMTQRYCLAKGHDQAERYGFFTKWRLSTVQTGNKNIWHVMPFRAAWQTFQANHLVALPANHNAAFSASALSVPLKTPIRNVYDFRTFVLRRLVDLYTADEQASTPAWHIKRGNLAALIGVSERSLQTYLDRAEIANADAMSAYGPDRKPALC